MKTYHFTTSVAALTLLLTFSKVTYACPPPVEITINCPSGDCDITIVTGNDNEIAREEKTGPIESIVDDILDFFRDIFKRKGDGGDDNDDDNEGGNEGSTPEGESNTQGGSSTGGSSGSSSSSTQASQSSFDKKLDLIASYFDHATVTENGLLLHYTPTQQCQSSFTMQYDKNIKLPASLLKKYKINTTKHLKAGRYTTNAKGSLLLPFSK